MKNKDIPDKLKTESLKLKTKEPGFIFSVFTF